MRKNRVSASNLLANFTDRRWQMSLNCLWNMLCWSVYGAALGKIIDRKMYYLEFIMVWYLFGQQHTVLFLSLKSSPSDGNGWTLKPAVGAAATWVRSGRPPKMNGFNQLVADFKWSTLSKPPPYAAPLKIVFVCHPLSPFTNTPYWNFRLSRVVPYPPSENFGDGWVSLKGIGSATSKKWKTRFYWSRWSAWYSFI